MEEKIIIECEEEFEGKRLDFFLSEKLEGLSRSYLQTLIKKEYVCLEDGKKLKSSYKVKKNDKVLFTQPEDKELELEAEDIPINIVYQDEDIVIINKEPYMVVHPAPGNYSKTLVNAILYHIKDLSGINGVKRPGIVHRLDKNTSGLIIIAKNDEAHKKLTEMFKDKTVDKTYVAIVKGRVKKKEGRIETLIGRSPRDRKKMIVLEDEGRVAISNYEVLEEKDDFSLVKINIETGRTHQIRVHMKHINCPILGDEVYGRASKTVKRQMLHAYKLEFEHPITGKHMSILSEIPDDFEKVMLKIGFETKL